MNPAVELIARKSSFSRTKAIGAAIRREIVMAMPLVSLRSLMN